MRLREALAGKLSEKELRHLRASFDVIGDIAIIEVPYELERRAKLIAKTVYDLLKNVNVVACKVGKHFGKYRRQRLRVLAGEQRLITTHRESGCVFKLDVEKCYFSPRMSHERLRVASLIERDSVFVACSGVGPFPIVIAKKCKASRVVGLELNPVAHRYAVENVRLNKVDVEVVQGDVMHAQDFVRGVFDRILIPAPREGALMLPGVLPLAKMRGCFVHVYDFAPEGLFEEAAQRVQEACRDAGYACSVRDVVKCGQHAPRVFRVCVDARVRKRY